MIPWRHVLLVSSLLAMMSPADSRAAETNAARAHLPAQGKPGTGQDWWRTAPKRLVPVAAPKDSAGTGREARPTFDWRQLESTDYREYVANLNTIGCPEQTIQDIVSADVIQAYDSRRRDAMTARYRDFKFWVADPDAVAELARQRRALDAEVEGVLQQLLGEQFVPPPMVASWRAAELEAQLAFLPEEKHKPVQLVLARYAETDVQFKQLADGHRKNEDTEELQQILVDHDREHAALAQLLTPAELDQVELVTSWTAHNLRRAMTRFHPTEAEFRVIFTAWKKHDENLARLSATGGADPGDGEVYEEVKGRLSAERYQEFVDTWWE